MWVFEKREDAEAAELAARDTLDVDRDAKGAPVANQITARWAEIVEMVDGRFAIPECPGMPAPPGAIVVPDSDVMPKIVAGLD